MVLRALYKILSLKLRVSVALVVTSLSKPYVLDAAVTHRTANIDTVENQARTGAAADISDADDVKIASERITCRVDAQSHHVVPHGGGTGASFHDAKELITARGRGSGEGMNEIPFDNIPV